MAQEVRLGIGQIRALVCLQHLVSREGNDQQVVDCAYCSQERKPRTKLGEGEEDCELEGDSDEEGT